MLATPRFIEFGFSTLIRYVVLPRRYVISNSRQKRGMHGSIRSRSPRSLTPRMYSSAARYIQRAEPAYQILYRGGHGAGSAMGFSLAGYNTPRLRIRVNAAFLVLC